MAGALSTGRLRRGRRLPGLRRAGGAVAVAAVHRGGRGLARGVAEHLLGVRWRPPALAVAAALVAGLRYGLLLAALAVIVSWSALWDKILSNGIGHALRDLPWAACHPRRRSWPAPPSIARTWRLACGHGGSGAANEIAGRAPRTASPGGDRRRRCGALTFTAVLRPGSPLFTVRWPRRACSGRSCCWSSSLLAVGYGLPLRGPRPAYVGGIGLADLPHCRQRVRRQRCPRSRPSSAGR